MEYSLQISLRASNDIVNAVDYYNEISAELCSRFLLELSHTYKKLTDQPQFYSLVSSNQGDLFRDVKLKRSLMWLYTKFMERTWSLLP